MIKIAICDDEPIMLNKIQNFIVDIIQKRKDEICIETFSHSKDFWEEYIQKEKEFDVILMDIDMPEISGFEIASKMKEMKRKSLLIFLTSHNELVFDAFKYQPFRYIRKNIMELELEEALNTAINNLSNTTQYYYCKSEDDNVRLDFNDILYFELVNRRVIFHMIDNLEYYAWSSIVSLMTKFEKHGYVQIHSGAAVNVKYIRSFTKKDVTLDNGERLPVSRGRSKEVVLSLSRYWGRKV